VATKKVISCDIAGLPPYAGANIEIETGDIQLPKQDTIKKQTLQLTFGCSDLGNRFFETFLFRLLQPTKKSVDFIASSQKLTARIIVF
jgi:hypothetical protein